MATTKGLLVTTALNQIYGENLNKRFELKGPEVLIGRNPKADIRLLCPNVSRKHCTLIEKTDGWFIKDNGSQNGTYVNGIELKPNSASLLQCGDIIFLGPPSEIPQSFCVEVDYKHVDAEGAKESEPQPINEPESRDAVEIIEVELPKPNKEIPGSKCTKKEENLIGNKSSDEDIAIVLEEEVKEDTKSNSSTTSTVLRSKRKTLPSSAVQSSKLPLKKIKIMTDAVPICETDKPINCNQVNEISSTENAEMDDSLSLLDINKVIESCALSSTDDINKPSCSRTNASLEKDETAVLKLKLAAMADKVKKLTEAKNLITKNYREDIRKQKDERLAEQERLKESLQKCELKAKNEVKKELFETFGEDLICIICSELLIKPSVLDCSHTFCAYCIKIWKKTKNDCPMCRKKIETVTRVLTLDNFIDKTVEKLTPEQKTVREKLIKERQELETKKASPKSKKAARRNRRAATRSQNRPQDGVEVDRRIRNFSRDSVEIIGENNVFPLGISALPFPLFLNTSTLRIPAAVRRSMDTLDSYL